MSRGKRGKKTANRKKHRSNGHSEKSSMANRSEVGTVLDRGEHVTNNAGEPADTAVDSVAGLKPGVSASLDECAISSSDCSLDSYDRRLPKGFGNGSKRRSAFSQGSVDDANEADEALQERAGEGGHADSNQSSSKMGFNDKAGDRHNQKGNGKKRTRPDVVLTAEEEAFLDGTELPIYLMPAVREIIQSRRNYEFLRKPDGSGKARILFEEALTKHGLAHAPDGVDPRLFPKGGASSKGSPNKRTNPATPDNIPQGFFQEELPTSPEVKKGTSEIDG